MELKVPADVKVVKIKEKLLENWPANSKTQTRNGKKKTKQHALICLFYNIIEVAPSQTGTKGIRLIAMGKMLEDNKTLGDLKIQKFEHATPVNVSLLPQGAAYSDVAPVAKPQGDKSKPPPDACCIIF